MLGAAYRGGVKETAFSGVFAIVRELAVPGAVPVVHDPLYSDPELRSLGLEPYRLGEPCDAVIMHTDHRRLRGAHARGPARRPGPGGWPRYHRRPGCWAAIPRRVLGIATASGQCRR